MTSKTEATAEDIAHLLTPLQSSGRFAARRTAPVTALHMEVKDVGVLRFPLTQKQARGLVAVGRPARFGLREKTLYDPKVRNCTEVPLSRLRLDERQFQRVLAPVLEELRSDLGLAEDLKVKVELQSMLVYGPGQFFAKHRDSEKDASMVATLVVTLPSDFKGGAITIEHQGEKLQFGANKNSLSFLAFYADCKHEVRPVTAGYRVVLTYNLMISKRKKSKEPAIKTDPKAVAKIAAELGKYFESPASTPARRQDAEDENEWMGKLVFLLDHQYTERALGWDRLKGDDAVRANALRDAASAAGCEATLALAEIHESWECYDQQDYGGGSRWNRGWDDDDDNFDDELDDEDPDDADEESHELGSLIDSDTTLDRWLDPDTGALEGIHADVDLQEIGFAKPNDELEPQSSEYEGYMGNYGNTLDRWYRRAAVLIWPQELGWEIRAELSPGWITRQTEECLRTGGEREATRLVEALLPSWQETVLHHESGELLSPVLRLASSVGSSHLATSLLKPFHLKALAEPHAAAVAELLRHYGASWFCALLASWREQSRFSARDSDSEAWIAELPRLAKRLLVADEQHGTEAARRILEDRWSWLKGALESAVTCETPKWRQERLAVLARSAFAFVLAAGIVGVPELLGQALDFLRDPSHEELLPLVLKVLEYARSEPGISRSSEAGIAELRGHAIQELRRRLSVPARKPEDWSIDWPRHCRCELCGTLARFLASPTQRVHEWPLATEGRRHVHGAIDSRELPVTHVTRRSGRPYTLILTKTQELFAREATARKLWEKALRSLTGSSKS